MKIAIVTYWDSNLDWYGNTTHEIRKNFCVMNGYTCIRDLNNYCVGRAPQWNKIKIILNLLEDSRNFDYIYWQDADSIFLKNDPIPINSNFDITITNDYLYTANAIGDRSRALDKKLFIRTNTGDILIKNTNMSRKILSAVWESDTCLNSQCHEQTTLDLILSEMRDRGYRNFSFFKSLEYHHAIIFKPELETNVFHAIQCRLFPEFLRDAIRYCTKDNNFCFKSVPDLSDSDKELKDLMIKNISDYYTKLN